MNQYRREGRNRPDDPTTAGEWVMTHSSTYRECIPLSRRKPASESICGLHSHAHFRAGSCPGLDDQVEGELECAFGRSAPPSPVGGSGSHLFQDHRSSFLLQPAIPVLEVHFLRPGAPGNPGSRGEQGHQSQGASRLSRAPRTASWWRMGKFRWTLRSFAPQKAASRGVEVTEARTHYAFDPVGSTAPEFPWKLETRAILHRTINSQLGSVSHGRPWRSGPESGKKTGPTSLTPRGRTVVYKGETSTRDASSFLQHKRSYDFFN